VRDVQDHLVGLDLPRRDLLLLRLHRAVANDTDELVTSMLVPRRAREVGQCLDDGEQQLVLLLVRRLREDALNDQKEALQRAGECALHLQRERLLPELGLPHAQDDAKAAAKDHLEGGGQLRDQLDELLHHEAGRDRRKLNLVAQREARAEAELALAARLHR